MFSGYPNDVNNTISAFDIVAPMSSYPRNIGAPDTDATQTAPNNDTNINGQSSNTRAMAEAIPGRPANWWVSFALVFIGFIFLARKYGGGESYSNIRMSVYNGLFLTFWIVLMLNLLKVAAAKFPPNPVSALVLAA